MHLELIKAWKWDQKIFLMKFTPFMKLSKVFNRLFKPSKVLNILGNPPEDALKIHRNQVKLKVIQNPE
jgi:hypothetical protein